MVGTELVGGRDDVEHADANGLLFRTGHHQVAAIGDHLVDRTAERTGQCHVTAVERSDSGSTTLRRNVLNASEVDTKVLQHLQQLEVGHVADRGVDLLTGQRCSRIGCSHPVVGMRNTVVGIGVGHSHADDLQRGTARHKVRKRRETLRVRDVDITGLHGQGHVATTAKRKPVHLDTEGGVVGLFDLGDLVGRRPLQEIRHVQLVNGRCR